MSNRIMKWQLVKEFPTHGEALLEIERLRAAGDALVASIRNYDLREEHIKTWKEARRG